jgi:hypothetical protein
VCAVTGGEEWLLAAAVTQKMAVQATLKLQQQHEDGRGGNAEAATAAMRQFLWQLQRRFRTLQGWWQQKEVTQWKAE